VQSLPQEYNNQVGRIEDQLKSMIAGQQSLNRGKSYNNKMMPQHQHIIGANIIKNASVMVTSFPNASAARSSELTNSYQQQTKTKRVANNINPPAELSTSS
jgi:hypothetical protein